MAKIFILNGKIYCIDTHIAVKDGKIFATDAEEEWKTINGSPVKIENGVITGGAEGKFNGMKRGGRMKYKKGNLPQDKDKNHPYWKTPEGKAEQWFSNRMGRAEHGTYTKEDKIKNIAEVARKRTIELNSKAAGINQEMDRLAKKSKWSKEDEKRNAELNKQRIEAEKEANAFGNEWRKWKAANNVKDPEPFKSVKIDASKSEGQKELKERLKE